MALNGHRATRSTNALQQRRGFTLLELMIVTLILAILAVLAAGPFMRARERAMMSATKLEARNALRFVEMYKSVYGTNPTQLADLDRVDYREGPQVQYCDFRQAGTPTNRTVVILMRHRALKRGVRTVYPEWQGRLEEVDMASCADLRSSRGGRR